MNQSALAHLDHRLLVTVCQLLTALQFDPCQQAALLGWDATALQDVLARTAPSQQSADQLERLLLTVELVRSVHGAYDNAAEWWLQRPLPTRPFNGQTPLAYLARGELAALQATVQYLDDVLRGRIPPSAEAITLAEALPQPEIDLEN